MSDLRLDPITGQWVAIAANRKERPNEFQQIQSRKHSGPCPFCVGNESETPQPLQVVAGLQDSEWVVRVVPNKYPSFPRNGAARDGVLRQQNRLADSSVNSPKSGCSDVDQNDCSEIRFEPEVGEISCGPYTQAPAAGVQEVIIHSPRHIESLSELNDNELTCSFQVFADRVGHQHSNRLIEHTMLFKNCRPEAGASLQHIHSQLIGTPLIPDQLRMRWLRMKDHIQQHGQSTLESIIEWELARQDRDLEVNDRFVVICPFASRFGYQIWIVPRNRRPSFFALDRAANEELARLCQKYVRRLEQNLGQPAYNMLFHFAPREFDEYEHWFVELFPRLTRPAGFEWGTGWWVNPYAPEEVASRLR